MGMARALGELPVSFDGRGVLVLCYHSVRTRAHFAAQMAEVAARGYTALSLGQFTDWLRRGKPVSTPAVLLTFDGGYRDQLEHAVPVLGSLALPATFFPVTCYLDDESAGVPAIRRADLVALVGAGHAVGCHTHTHPSLTALPAEAVEREVVASKQRLEDLLGEPVSAFAYPYGDADARVAGIVERAGFEVAFTVDLGGVRPGDDPYRLKRLPVLGQPGRVQLGAYLSGAPFLSGGLLLYWKVRERGLSREGGP
ncbi:MAG TPA: polysaccharide deacetylase family protein [Methylomirabilota bacterium]|nr:polysaccharide deacetylase family protein [Methylomirabilota bacterium]